MDQNIFDNQAFFDGYKHIKENEASANNLVEKPALFSLCPSIVGAHVLDMGCGYGENYREFIRLGAMRVVGIDLSEKMLEIAKTENYDAHITYLQMSMNDPSLFTTPFDLILSSLAMHYIEDFDALLKAVFHLLKPNGIFIFSQEHPLTTASKKIPIGLEMNTENLSIIILERIVTWEREQVLGSSMMWFLIIAHFLPLSIL